MAHTVGSSARAHRLIGLVATVLLAVTTALAFGRVFLGAASTGQLVGAALAAAGLAVAFERRSLLLSTAISAIGLALAVALIVFPETTWYGLPTADSLRAALDAAALVGEQARIQPAPAEPIAPLVLAAVTSLWAAVFSAHALAFRAGSPLLGLVPPVALVAFADSVLEEFVKPLYGLAFLAAALLVVFSDGLARVQGWGPVWSSGRGFAAAAGRGARRLAFTALGLALIAPVVVPGFGSQGLVDFGTPAEDRVAIDPFVSVQSSLQQRTPVEVLRVTADSPGYIRLVSLPEFDGVGWRPAEASQGVLVEPGEELARLDGPAGAATPATIEVVTDLAQHWLPAPYPIRSVEEVPGRDVRFDPDTGTAFVDAPLEQGDVYTVTTSLVKPSATALRRVRPDAPLEGGRYLDLPENMPPEIEELALAWTAGAESTFDKVVAIEERLHSSGEFRYQVDTRLRAGTRSLLEFLQVSKAGFCQQFATSMAALLRSIGIQSRVAMGFATGTPTSTPGQYSVSTNVAHAWVEVYFPGWGWMPFEPTPGRINAVSYAEPAATCPGPDCVDAPTGGTGETPTGVREAIDRAFENDPRVTGPRGAVGDPGTIDIGDDSPPIGARAALLLAAVAAGIVLLLVPPVRALRRRVRLRRAADEPRRLILVTYEVFTERAAGLGLGRGPGETLEEYRRKVTETGYLANGNLDRLTGLATAAAYSQHEPDEGQADAAGHAATTAIREIRRAVGPTAWLVGLYRRR
ncbi:MAG: transglutaminase TgpA family protein [Actinomycetota bacterium]